jgi:hypothetical protein
MPITAPVNASAPAVVAVIVRRVVGARAGGGERPQVECCLAADQADAHAEDAERAA